MLDILARLQRTASSASPEIQAHIERAERQYRSGQYQQVYHSLNAVWALDPSIAGLRADRLTAFSAWRLCEYHAKALGRAPDLLNPSTYNEHILKRIIFDRDPRLKTLNDKVAVRAYIEETVGDFNVPIHGVWDSVDAIDWATLPDQFVLKPSHSSGEYRIVRGKANLDRDRLIAEARDWLSRDFSVRSLEWGYTDLPRLLIVEPLLRPASGEFLVEIQVYAVDGRAALIRPWTGAKGSADRRGAWYLPDLQRLEIATGLIGQADLPIDPALRDVLVSAAERAAAGFSFLRVDFYMTGEGLRIGELTPYSGGGRTQFRPPERDAQLGRLWSGDFELFDIPRYAGPAMR